MTDPDVETKYYAPVGLGRGRDDPAGLMRRRFVQSRPEDEALQRDFTWRRTAELIRWEWGEVDSDFVEISAEEAARLIEHFRAKWTAEDDPPTQ